MASIARLLTFVDVVEEHSNARQMSVSARHEALLDDGRHVLLLDDRGWSSSFGGSPAIARASDGDTGRELPERYDDVPTAPLGQAPGADSRQPGTGDIWAVTSVEEMVTDARVVVGPDEPFGGRSFEDMEADHWNFLAQVLRRQGVVAVASELKRLPHDVVLSAALLARLGRSAGGATEP